ncbi:hypothetical protein ACFLU6_13465, partial [Acidobacteriota bacterium]
MFRIIVAVFIPLLVLLPAAAMAEEPSLTRIDRQTPDDRAYLLSEGIPLVAEFSSCLLAYGDAEILSEQAAGLG